MKRQQIIDKVIDMFIDEVEILVDEGYDYNSDEHRPEYYFTPYFNPKGSYSFNRGVKWCCDVAYNDGEWRGIIYDEESGKPYPNISKAITKALNELNAESIYYMYNS